MIVVQRDIRTKPRSFPMIAQPLQPHCRLSPHKCLHLLMPAITLPLCLASCTPSPACRAVCPPPAGPLLMGPGHTQCLLAATMSEMRQPLQQCPCVFPAKPHHWPQVQCIGSGGDCGAPCDCTDPRVHAVACRPSLCHS